MEKQVVLAKTAGFCFGVNRAMDCVEKLIREEEGSIRTYGPLINNEEVVASLTARGVRVLQGEDDISTLDAASTIVIRSHGVGREVEERLRATGARIVDATCPFVKKIHRIVAEASAKGRQVVVIGDPNHPEVVGIRGWSGPDTYVVEAAEAAEQLNLSEKVTIVSQTTFNYEKVKKIVESLEKRCYDVHVVNTICNATQERQSEAKQIAANVEAMIVVGSKNSSNTQKLYSICKAHCAKTYYIQTVRDLETEIIPNVRSIGITAGASTPKNIIEEVQTYARRKL